MAGMSPSPQTILQQSLSLHRQGDAAGAERLYRAVLAEQPGHAEAAHNLGRGLAGPQVDALLQRAQSAMVLSPLDMQFERATALAVQGQMQDAIAAYRQVIVQAPDHAEAHFRLGSLLSETGQIAEGFGHYMRRAALVHQNGA